MSNTSLFMSPERVICGTGAVEQLGELLKEFGTRKVLVVTDDIVAHLDAFETVKDSLEKADIDHHVYSEVDANPTDVQVEKGAKVFSEHGADALVGVGGGSSMDTAKAIGILVNNGGSITDYDFGTETDFTQVKAVSNLIPPLIAIPTTSGTGAEVSAWAVVTNTKDNYKFFPGGWQVLPKVALVDPLMTASMPPLVTASTGMDALSHAIEAIVSPYAIPQTDAFAFSAIRLIMKHIGPAVSDGSNIEAREGMAMAAMEAGLSMNAWCGGVHALGHQLTTQYGMPHGMAMGLMMPVVMNFNLIARLDRFIDIAIAMGENVEGLSLIDAAQKAPQAVFKLVKALGLPTSLKEYGADPQRLPDCAEWSLKDSDLQGNPRTMTREQVDGLFQKAFEGAID